MGCINGKQLLNEEDLNYIARNTAMDKAAVEVRTNQTCKCYFMMSVLKYLEKANRKLVQLQIHLYQYSNCLTVNWDICLQKN